MEWYTHEISALKRWRQKNQKFKIIVKKKAHRESKRLTGSKKHLPLITQTTKHVQTEQPS